MRTWSSKVGRFDVNRRLLDCTQLNYPYAMLKGFIYWVKLKKKKKKTCEKTVKTLVMMDVNVLQSTIE